LPASSSTVRHVPVSFVCLCEASQAFRPGNDAIWAAERAVRHAALVPEFPSELRHLPNLAGPNHRAIASGDPTYRDCLSSRTADLWIPRSPASTKSVSAAVGSICDGTLVLEGVLGPLVTDVLRQAGVIEVQEFSSRPGPRQWRPAGQGRGRLGTSRPAAL
jgi:hypothetical protein